MVIAVIDEFKNTDASADISNSIEDVNDFLVTPSTADAVNSLDLSSAEIADREGDQDIKDSHRPLSQGQENPLDKCAVHLFPWLGVMARRVLAFPASSAAPERLFSTAGNVMTKKRSRLKCDNMEELVYLHEVGCRCRSGRRSNTCAWSDFF